MTIYTLNLGERTSWKSVIFKSGILANVPEDPEVKETWMVFWVPGSFGFWHTGSPCSAWVFFSVTAPSSSSLVSSLPLFPGGKSLLLPFWTSSVTRISCQLGISLTVLWAPCEGESCAISAPCSTGIISWCWKATGEEQIQFQSTKSGARIHGHLLLTLLLPPSSHTLLPSAFFLLHRIIGNFSYMKFLTPQSRCN